MWVELTATGHAIEAILITDKAGSTRFYMQLDPRAFGMDPVQASIFFAALDMFSDELFEESEPAFHLDYGPRVFSVLKGVEANLIAVGAKRLSSEVMDLLNTLLAEFELEWLPAAKSIGPGSSFEDAYYESFGERVMKNLSLEDLPDSWIPYFTTNPDTLTMISTTIAPLIDGSRSVKEIRNASGLSKSEMLTETSRLWAHRVIRFRNMLSFDDFVGAKTPFLRYIQADSIETQNLKRLHPEMAEVLPRLAGLMDGRRTVREMVAELGGSYDERQVLRMLDHLLEDDVIETLSSEKRRILLVKQALEISLRVAEDINRAQAAQAMRSVVDRSVTPETLGQLHFVDNSWAVDFDFKLLEGLSYRRLMLLYGEWMKILAQFVAALERENLYVFIAIVTEEFHDRIVSRYAARDLAGLEEFSFWLETLSTEILFQPRVIRTGSLEATVNDGSEELAYLLVTRGQVIHGQERISRICTTAGVPLTDVPPDFWAGWQKAESIDRLLVEYAKLGHASKLTLLILSRQLGVSLPKEITF